jgi:hypothetical protein
MENKTDTKKKIEELVGTIFIVNPLERGTIRFQATQIATLLWVDGVIDNIPDATVAIEEVVSIMRKIHPKKKV